MPSGIYLGAGLDIFHIFNQLCQYYGIIKQLFCCFEMPPLEFEFLFIFVFASRDFVLFFICFFCSYSHHSSPLGLRRYCSHVCDS